MDDDLSAARGIFHAILIEALAVCIFGAAFGIYTGVLQ